MWPKLDPATNVWHGLDLKPTLHISHYSHTLKAWCLKSFCLGLFTPQPLLFHSLVEKYPSICSAQTRPDQTKRNLKRKYFVEIHPFSGDGWWWRNFYKCVNGILDDPFLMNHMNNNNTSTQQVIPGHGKKTTFDPAMRLCQPLSEVFWTLLGKKSRPVFDSRLFWPNTLLLGRLNDDNLKKLYR